MTTLRVTVLASLFFLVSACAPSAPPPTAVLTWDAQALATQIAASIFATQTASIPTASNTPDATEIPTATPQPTDTSTTLPSVSATAAPCVPTDQDQYVYHAYRLQVLQPCLRVSGVLDAIRSEQDGDRHILLHVDPAFQYLLRPSNQGEELGDLVIEPICVSVPTQADAIAPCSLDPDPFRGPLPSPGQHVWIEGRYVLDHDHGDWGELHPLYRWGLVSAGAAPLSTAIGAPITSLSLQVISLTSPIQRGANATLVIGTAPGAACTITVYYKSGPSTAQGLAPKTADPSGQRLWTWKVGTRTTPGTWSIYVTTRFGGQSKSLTLPFVVQ